MFKQIDYYFIQITEYLLDKHFRQQKKNVKVSSIRIDKNHNKTASYKTKNSILFDGYGAENQ